MRSLLLSFLVALPLLAQLPSGTTRVHFRDYMWAYGPGRMSDAVFGSDGALYAAVGGDKLVRITTDGERTEFPAPRLCECPGSVPPRLPAEVRKSTITIFDPALAPILSIETLDHIPRRRSARQ